MWAVLQRMWDEMMDISKEQPQCENCTKEEIDKQVNIFDQFIANGGFDKAFNDVFGLPESVIESLKEVP